MSFLETGHHQTGAGDIAKRTGVSLGNRYNHFSDKRCASFLAYVSPLTSETPSLPTKTIWHFLPTFFYSLGMLGLIVAASDLDWLLQMPFAKRDQISSPMINMLLLLIPCNGAHILLLRLGVSFGIAPA